MKDNDKDNYLVSKLNGSKWFTHSDFGEYVIDRMIVATFLTISARNNDKRQILTAEAIRKLFLYIQPADKIKSFVISKFYDLVCTAHRFKD